MRLFKACISFFIKIFIFLIITSCNHNISSESEPTTNYTLFKNPEPMAITGYSDNAMEPCISRDGNYLFFNNNKAGDIEKDIFYATRIDDTTFAFQRALSEINCPAVDGAPAIDNDNNLFFVTLTSYNPPSSHYSLYRGTWTGSAVTGSSYLNGLYVDQTLVVYFDIEVSYDGSTLYLSKGDFNGGNPRTADIVIAVKSGSDFAYDPGRDYIMAGVNTPDKLEYAPALSIDELELFFTRLDQGTSTARIYRAVRADRNSAFGSAQLVSAIEGFAEGAVLSPDEKSLYYHRLNTENGKFEIYRVTRE